MTIVMPVNKGQRKPKAQSRMENTETLATSGTHTSTQDEDKKQTKTHTRHNTDN